METEQIMEIKPKRKYAKKEKTIEKKSTDTKSIENFIDMSFNIFSNRYGDHWKLSDIEKKELAKPMSEILEKFNIDSKYSPIFMLFASMGMILTPRIYLQLELAKIQKSEKKEEEKEKFENEKKEVKYV